MTNTDLFKKAHKIARLTATAAGSYKIAFVAALKDLRSGAYDLDTKTLASKTVSILKAFGANVWMQKAGVERVYINYAALDMGYDYEKSCGMKNSYFMADDAWKNSNSDVIPFLMWVYANAASLKAKAPRKAARRGYDADYDADAVAAQNWRPSAGHEALAARIAREAV